MYYQFADLVLRSELPLAELPSASQGPAECRVRSGPIDRSGASGQRWDHHWPSADGGVALSCARDGDAYRVGMSGLATFLVEGGGSEITCRPVDALPHVTLEHMLIDQVLPRVLAHRGRLVIHAGCVETPGGAIGFLGASGAGKSTLCGEFARAGHALLGDDGVVVREAHAGGFEVIATYPGLRLLPDPLACLFDVEAGGAPVAHYTTKRRLDRNRVSLAMAAGPRALRAVYFLDGGSRIEIAPLTEREGFMALLTASFQLHLDDRERAAELFLRIGALQSAVPVRRLTYPRDFARLPAVREALLADAAG